MPLTSEGPHATQHLFDQEKLTRLQKNCLLVNAARGPVINNKDLLEVIDQRPDLTVFLDTWENEPGISRELLAKVDLATPHIAGYSVEGRLRGTQMILDAAARHFGSTSPWHMARLLPETIELNLRPAINDLEYWQRVFSGHHDIWVDHQALTQTGKMGDEDFTRHFDSLRRVYQDRFEYDRYRLTNVQKKQPAIARGLGFKV